MWSIQRFQADSAASIESAAADSRSIVATYVLVLRLLRLQEASTTQPRPRRLSPTPTTPDAIADAVRRAVICRLSRRCFGTCLRSVSESSEAADATAVRRLFSSRSDARLRRCPARRQVGGAGHQAREAGRNHCEQSVARGVCGGQRRGARCERGSTGRRRASRRAGPSLDRAEQSAWRCRGANDLYGNTRSLP
jgi:hypothetical protein